MSQAPVAEKPSAVQLWCLHVVEGATSRSCTKAGTKLSSKANVSSVRLAKLAMLTVCEGLEVIDL